MKHAAKPAFLFLALMILLLLSACGVKTREVLTPEPPETEVTQLEPDPAVGRPGEVAEEPRKTDDIEVIIEPPASGAYTPGTFTEESYISEFAGLGFSLPEGWTFQTAEDLAELNGFVPEVQSTEALQAALADSGLLFDMYAMNDDGTNVTVVIEDCIALFGRTMELEEYYVQTNEQLSEIFASTGGEVLGEYRGTTFAGKETELLFFTVDVGSGTVLYEQVVSIPQGDYMITVTISGYSEEAVLAASEHFYAL